MSSSPQRAPLIVPQTPPSTKAPFVIIVPTLPTAPTALAADEPETLEAHWHSAIDAATD